MTILEFKKCISISAQNLLIIIILIEMFVSAVLLVLKMNTLKSNNYKLYENVLFFNFFQFL